MTETIAFPLWAAAAAVAVLALFAILAVARMGGRQALAIGAVALLLVGGGWLVLERMDDEAGTEQRRAIEARFAALNAQVSSPGSNLACLDAPGGELVHEACERTLFSGPEQVAAALNFVAARIDLLRDLAALPRRDAPAYDSLRGPLLRSLEADRFGFYAQILVERDRCSAADCFAFGLVERRDRLAANMAERAYDKRVSRYAASWADKPDGSRAPALASQPQPEGPGDAALTVQPPSHKPVNIDFPSAASIPPVSIMSNEPGRTGQNGVEPAARPDPKPEPKSEAKPQAAPAPQQAASPPVPPRRPAQKAQSAPARSAPPAAAAPATADPFPQPVGSAQQTTGTQQQ
ncbi:hypothetical protein [Pseudorhodoplanes sp.]|uniref:hypothetical protein n=1 Tax=Pseudorhodoplanes sp. TaxID=1934341 RepID=UPI00391C23A2